MIVLDNVVDGLIKVIELIFEDVKVLLIDVGYINVYGIFILLNDKIEILGIKCVFKEYVYDLNVFFIKGVIGYMLGVIGVVESIFCIKVL